MSERIQKLLNEAEESDEGKSSVSSAERHFQTAEEAGENFERFRRKLYDVNHWELESGVSAFRLFDENGNALEAATARVGNFIRISLPGSGKHDWVKIVDIFDADDEVIITVQPSRDPTEKRTEREGTSHFFTSEAANNFCLWKKHSATVAFHVIGLREKPNLTETDSVIEAARNVATAAFGWLGFQKIEWQTFCENFLEVKK